MSIIMRPDYQPNDPEFERDAELSIQPPMVLIQTDGDVTAIMDGIRPLIESYLAVQRQAIYWRHEAMTIPRCDFKGNCDKPNT